MVRAARVVTVGFAVIAVLAALVLGGRAFLASDAGRALIVRALPLYAPQSGLRVRAGRIEGNVFGTLRIHDLDLADPAGTFAHVPVLDLAWQPLTLIQNRLTVRSAVAPEVAVLRRPRLRPSADTRVLPDIDIVVGRLSIARIDLAAAVTGRAEALRLDGHGEAVRGRARLALDAISATGGDRLHIALDAEPDADRFDVAAMLAAPARGTLARLGRLPGALDATVAGKGTWRAWTGSARARLAGRQLADLAVSETAGRVILAGTVAPAPLLDGVGATATAGGVRMRADGRLAARVLTGRVDAVSAAVRMSLAGSADFGREVFAGVRVEARALRPALLFPQLSGRDIVLAARVGGTFATPVADYVFTSPAFAWGSTGFTGLRAAGRVVGSAPLVVPVAASVASVSGVGADAAPLLKGLRVTGPLVVANHAITGARLGIAAAGVRGTAGVRLAFDGGYAATFDGVVPGYRAGDLGVVDVAAKVRAFPAPGGTRVTGTVRAVATRLDSGLFRTAFAGLPVATSAIDVAPDLSIRFDGVRIAAPGLTLIGSGTQDPAGVLHLAARGTSRDYGPVALTLAGPAAAPVVDLALAAPGFGVTAMTVHVAPTPAGWTVAARGTTAVGPASLDARLAPGGIAADIDASAAGVRLHGPLTFDAANHATGQLTIGGSGLSGALAVAPAGAGQRFDLALTAAGAQLGGVRIGSGTVTARGVTGDGPLRADARIALAGAGAGGTVLTSTTATLAWAKGGGTAAVTAAGSAGVPFAVALDARGGNDRIEFGGSATFDGRRVTLDHRAVAIRAGSVWRLAPVALVTPDGRVEIGGSAGDGMHASVRADGVGLSLLTLASPDLNLGGRLSGTLAVDLPAVGPPTGSLSARVAGLTRAGLAASSVPVDVAVNAALTATSASGRAVIVRGGVAVGRAQAALTLAPGGALRDRLLAAPLFAQVRFDGPAQALWALAGVEAIDVRGPVSVALDAGGRLGDPRLTGTIAARGARVENLTLGTVVDTLTLDGRFAGSRLDVTVFDGVVGTGRIAGSASVDLSAERGFPLDATIRLDDAAAIKRDDLRATATGTLKVHSDGGAGRISGVLDIVRARYRLGRATAAADVPALAVEERHAELLGRAAVRPTKPTAWQVDVTLAARDNIAVEGLGLTSVWRGALKVGGRATAPEISGRVELVRGDYDFAGKRFSLTRGDVRFNGGTPPDPVIDIVAENTSSGFTAELSLTGTALHPDIRFASVPALPEDEVLARVLFGSSITTLSAPEAIQLAGALASLRNNGRSGVLDPFGAVRKGLRIDRLRALPADTTTGRKTSIAAGKYIGRRLYVELATDAQGYSATSIEIALSRSFSILSTVATLGGTSVNLRVKRDY